MNTVNNTNKLFVVSDIHGHFTMFKEALEKAGFDKNNKNHFIICCGDYFDRGDENVQVMKFFERLDNKILLRGNHEDLLLKLLKTGTLLPHNYINGTMATLNNFFGKYSINPEDDTIDFSGKTRTVDRLCEFIEETINYFETDKFVFVHGWLPENCDSSKARINASDSDWEGARWVKWTDKYNGKPPLKDKILICGHMPTFYAGKFDSNRTRENAEIFYGNGMIAIDAGTTDSGRVNILVLEDKISK